MNFDFLDRRSAERFAELLDETTGGHRHHSRGPADEQLAELVTIGSSLSAARPGVRVDTEFRAGLRAMLVATAERDGIGRTATAVEDATAMGQPAARTGRMRRGLLGHGGRIRARGAIVIGVAAGAMAVSGISAASENASPGDALYGVKRSTERAQLAMAGSDVSRGQLSLDFARTRLAEAAAMRGGDAGFAGVLDDMDADTRKGVKLLTTAAVAGRDNKPLATIDGFVERQRRMLTPALGELASGNRERATRSLSLLDQVRERAADLRTGLTCDNVVSAGSDLLGPRLRDCRQTADSSAPSRPSADSGKATDKSGTTRVRPERKPSTEPRTSAGTGVAPGTDADQDAGKGTSNAPGTGTGTGTGVGSNGADDVEPTLVPELPLDGTTAETEAPAEPGTDGDAKKERDFLDGLFGGIFGSD